MLIKNDGSAKEHPFKVWRVSAPDEQAAAGKAADEVVSVADALIKAHWHMPAAAEFSPSDRLIKIPWHCAMKIAIRELMLQNGYGPSVLAQRLGMSRQYVNAALSLQKRTSFELLDKIFEALGCRLELSGRCL